MPLDTGTNPQFAMLMRQLSQMGFTREQTQTLMGQMATMQQPAQQQPVLSRGPFQQALEGAPANGVPPGLPTQASPTATANRFGGSAPPALPSQASPIAAANRFGGAGSPPGQMSGQMPSQAAPVGSPAGPFSQGLNTRPFPSTAPAQMGSGTTRTSMPRTTLPQRPQRSIN